MPTYSVIGPTVFFREWAVPQYKNFSGFSITKDYLLLQYSSIRPVGSFTFLIPEMPSNPDPNQDIIGNCDWTEPKTYDITLSLNAIIFLENTIPFPLNCTTHFNYCRYLIQVLSDCHNILAVILIKKNSKAFLS